MYVIKKWDDAYEKWRYVEPRHKTTVFISGAEKFETEEKATQCLSSLQKNGSFYNNYKVYQIESDQPINERQLNMFAKTTAVSQIKTTTPKTKNPI